MIRLNRTFALGAFGTAVLIAGACDGDRAITSEPVGEIAFGTSLAAVPTSPAASNLPRGAVVFPASPIGSANPANDSIIVGGPTRLLGGLDSLTSGVYAVWVGNDSGTVFRRATGTLVVTRTDTSLNAQGDPVILPTVTRRTNVSSWAVGGQNYTMSFRFARSGVAGLTARDTIGTVLVTVETSAGATTPGSRRFLWARRFASTSTVIMRFGNYAPNPANEFLFALNGVSPITPRGKASVRGNAFVVVDSNLYRPPVGFYYAAWAIRFDTLGFQQLDNSVYLGRATTPFPDRQSLYDADSIIVDPEYVLDNPRVIIAQGHRVISDTIASLSSRTENFWRDFGRVIVTLENKAAAEGVRPGPAIILSGVLPPSVRGR